METAADLSTSGAASLPRKNVMKDERTSFGGTGVLFGDQRANCSQGFKGEAVADSERFESEQAHGHLHGLAPLTARLAARSVAADIPQVRLVAGVEVPLHRLEVQLQPRLHDLADGRLARTCTTQQQSAYAWLCHFAVLGSP